MLKLGLIARQDNSGLGIQTWEAYNHLHPSKTMVVDFTAYKDMKQYPERYQDALTVHGIPDFQQTREFLKDLDLVFTCETPYSYHFLETARQMGVKTIIQPNYEFSGWIKNPTLPRPDLFVIPSRWHYDEFPEPKVYLPVPIATEHFKPNTSESATRFLHIAGWPAANDRNGTRDLLEALKQVKSNIEMTIFCQKPDYLVNTVRGNQLPRNVRLIMQNIGPDNYWEIYDNQDVLVMPRRYGGLCLPVNEAFGAGLPVIMPDIEPNNKWLPKEWLYKADLDFTFQPGRLGSPIDVYKSDPEQLAKMIDKFASSRDFYTDSKTVASQIAEDHSWEKLLPLYQKTFSGILKLKHDQGFDSGSQDRKIRPGR